MKNEKDIKFEKEINNPKIKLHNDLFVLIPNTTENINVVINGWKKPDEAKCLIKSIEDRINVIYKFSPDYKNIYYFFFSKNYEWDFIEIDKEGIFNIEKIKQKNNINDLKELLDKFNKFYFYLMNYDVSFLEKIENKALNILELIDLERGVSYFLYGEIQKFENDLKNVFLKTLILLDCIIEPVFGVRNNFFPDIKYFQSEAQIDNLKEKFINDFFNVVAEVFF